MSSSSAHQADGYYDDFGRYIYGHYNEYNEWIDVGFYDESNTWVDLTVTDVNGKPIGNKHDKYGRLLDQHKLNIITDDGPEELPKFVSKWRGPLMASAADAAAASKVAWPDIPFVVHLKRLDIFESVQPKAQQATTNQEESRRIR